ncbi:hypothetical protein [Rubinisphaera margarita]|uniref:hypothetical protein n=1 Tax=Rubinisphaera margarita TaxID=2909586 RepID=UPI001EE944C6|nr:hypothetical protein [Rubinisphaera margarita]MCG6155253.1 hypothetical protein [Rubinisphaera margarita]
MPDEDSNPETTSGSVPIGTRAVMWGLLMASAAAVGVYGFIYWQLNHTLDTTVQWSWYVVDAETGTSLEGEVHPGSPAGESQAFDAIVLDDAQLAAFRRLPDDSVRYAISSGEAGCSMWPRTSFSLSSARSQRIPLDVGDVIPGVISVMKTESQSFAGFLGARLSNGTRLFRVEGNLGYGRHYSPTLPDNPDFASQSLHSNVLYEGKLLPGTSLMFRRELGNGDYLLMVFEVE